MSSDTHSPPAVNTTPAVEAAPTVTAADESVVATPAPAETQAGGNVRRPAPSEAAAALPETPAPTKDTAAKSEAAPKTKAEDRMIPAMPVALTLGGTGLMAVGIAAQAGSAAAGPLGAVVGGGAAAAALAAAAMSARGRRRTSNRRRTRADRRAATRAGMHAAQSGGPLIGRRAASSAQDSPFAAPAPRFGGKLGRRAAERHRAESAGSTGAAATRLGGIGSSTRTPGASHGDRRRSEKNSHRPGAAANGAASHTGPGSARAVSPGSARRAASSHHGVPTGSRSGGIPSRGAGAGAGRTARFTRPGGGKGARFHGGKALKNRAASYKTGGKGSRNHGPARTRAGRLANAAGRYGSAPFKAIGAGVVGARKGGSPIKAASAARRRAIKDHRVRTGAHKRTRYPFRGWGSAAAGLGVSAGSRLGKMMVRMWKWNPWEAEEKERAAAEAKQQKAKKKGAVTPPAAPAAGARPNVTTNPTGPAAKKKPSPAPGPSAAKPGGKPASGPSAARPAVNPAKPGATNPTPQAAKPNTQAPARPQTPTPPSAKPSTTPPAASPRGAKPSAPAKRPAAPPPATPPPQGGTPPAPAPSRPTVPTPPAPPTLAPAKPSAGPPPVPPIPGVPAPVPLPSPSRPAPIQPPAPPAPTPGGNPMSGVPTINQLIAISEEMKRLATLRSAPGARKGLLELLEDSKGWAIVMANVAEACGKETAAWQRFPVDRSIPAMYDAVNQTATNAARAMAGIPGTINRIEADTIDRLLNPRVNAQMLDHTYNGYTPGQG